MKTKIMGIITIALVLGFGGMAKADIVELDLFDLGCPAEFNGGPYWKTDFDLGVTFIEITSVYMDWSGEITGGLAISLDPITFEPIGEPFHKDIAISAYLDMPIDAVASVWGGRVIQNRSHLIVNQISNYLDLGHGLICWTGGLQSTFIVNAQ